MSFPPRLVLLPALVLFGPVLSSCSKSSNSAPAAAMAAQRQPVEVVAVARRDLTETLSLVGSLAPNETAQIRAEISGQVRAVLFEEGEHVAKGKVLLKIDDAELRAQLGQAEARFHLAELNFKRSQDLTEARSMSQAEADRTHSDYAAAEAELELLRVRLGKMEIKAPFDGIIGARSVSTGDYVTAQSSITTLDDLSRLKIDFQVPERFTAKVKPGTLFTISSPVLSTDETVQGEVYFAASVIDRATRSTQVKGYITTTNPALKPGMFANIDLVLEVRRQVLTVPEGAILTTAGGASLIAVKNAKDDAVADFVPVKLGLRSHGFVEVQPLKQALGENQLIVASGVGGLTIFPGTKLEPRPLKEIFRSVD